MDRLGYSYLNQHYQLRLPKLRVQLYMGDGVDGDPIVDYGASKRKIIAKTAKLAAMLDCPYQQMILAITYQGIRLHFFAAIFNKLNVAEFTAFIGAKPNAHYHRVLWFLYEWLTTSRLDLPDLTGGNYIRLFKDEHYFTVADGQRDRRTRVVNNAIGSREFCPTVRKTAAIKKLAKINVYDTAWAQMQKIGELLSADMIGRSFNYLYTKETKSSTEIEKEQPSQRKMQRFLNAVKNVGLFDLSKQQLLDLQNKIVEDKAQATDYRKDEIYVGTTIQRFGLVDEDVHYIGPLACHVPSMMDGLLATHDRLMLDGQVPSLIHAAVISFGEVYIHPMNDGNGRIHRYLIHDVMKQRDNEHQFIIPISAAIIKNQKKYDQVLESISRPIMAMLDWELDSENNNRVIINNDIDYFYRYPDYTEHVQFTYDMMNTAIVDDLLGEVCLLIVFDKIKQKINQSADIANNTLDTLVSIIINGGGKVSNKKRPLVLKQLTEPVMAEAEQFATDLMADMRLRLDVDVQALMTKSV